MNAKLLYKEFLHLVSVYIEFLHTITKLVEVTEYCMQTVQAGFAFQAADHCYYHLYYEQLRLVH